MSATVAAVRPTATLTPEQRRRLRLARERAERADERARQAEDAYEGTIRALIDEGAAMSAVARELGVSRQVLWARLRAGDA